MRTIFLLLIVLFHSLTLQALDLRFASWNIERLGHGQQKSYATLARVANQFDFLAIQELMTEEALHRLRQELESVSGERWEAIHSHLLGPGSYKEMYGFIWRRSAVSYVDGAVVYLDDRQLFVREPYSARFRSRATEREFVAATVHVLYGRSVADRVAEVEALSRYWQWLEEVYPETSLYLLAGDFNLAPSHAAWASLRRHALPLIVEGASTLSAVDGRYANLYDNIWLPPRHVDEVVEAGVYRFPQQLGWSHEQARRHVSDHAPVYARIGAGARPIPRELPEAKSRAAVPRSGAEAVRGNRRSRIYHRPDCPGHGRIAEANRVPFESPAAAEAAGYRLAGNCP